MNNCTFPEEVERQAAAFDTIGASYEDAFGNNAVQLDSVNWLLARLPDSARVLDAGCGTGVPTARILADAGCRVVGIDISQEMLRLAREQVPGAEFLRMDMADLHLGDLTFHGITAFFSLLMLRKQQFGDTLAHLVSHLTPGGYFVLSMVEADMDYAPDRVPGHPAALHRISTGGAGSQLARRGPRHSGADDCEVRAQGRSTDRDPAILSMSAPGVSRRYDALRSTWILQVGLADIGLAMSCPGILADEDFPGRPPRIDWTAHGHLGSHHRRHWRSRLRTHLAPA